MSLINNPQRSITPGLDTSESVFQVSEIKMVSDVINVYRTYPLTGTFSDEDVSGWSWSRTFAQNLNERRERINNSLESKSSSYEEGSKLENWQGCVISGIEHMNTEVVYDNFRSRWVPKYSTGEYSIYHKSKRLFSDYSNSKTLIEEFIPEDLEIDPEARLNEFAGNIKNEFIAIYKRDKRFVNFPFYKYEYDTNLEKENSYYVEEVEDVSRVILNELKQIKVGGNYELALGDYPQILGTWEYAGKGNDERSVIYTEYFPVVEGSLKLIEKLSNGNLREWQEVEKFSYNNSREFILDSLNGIITINSINDVITRKIKNITEQDGTAYSKISFYEKVNLDKNNGFISISNVKIEYKDLTEESLYVLTAEYNNIDSPEEVIFIKEGSNFQLNSELYLMYTATVRIDYETEAEETHRSDNDIDLKPYKSSESRGLIEINPYEKHVNGLNISSSLSVGEFLKMGTESLKIQAVATNSALGVVKEVPVSFYCDFGYFNNGNKNYFNKTNQDGNAYAYYNWPYDERDSYIWITGDNVKHVNGNTILKVGSSEISRLGVEDAVIFQTLKIDPFYGNFGQELRVETFEIEADYLLINLKDKINNLEEYVGNEMNYIENKMQELPEGFCKEATNNHSFGYVFWNATFNRGEKFLILKIEDEYTIKVKKSFFLEERIRRIDQWNTVREGKVRLYKASEMEYSEEIRRERGLSYDRLLYEDDGINLVSIKPTRVLNETNMYRIMYAGKLLPLANENDSNNIVAGYKMFLNKKALIYAETKDPATGRTIRSNSLTINVSLPDFLKNENGFTFGNNEDLGSGLGGANFITLENLTESIDDSGEIILYNPFRNGINIIIDNTEE